MDVISLAKAKAGLSEVVGRVSAQHERVVVTVHGHPQVVIMATDDLAALEETIEILSDSETLRRLVASDAELARSEGEGIEQLAAAMDARRRKAV
jgi:prevent-host-death family protein